MEWKLPTQDAERASAALVQTPAWFHSETNCSQSATIVLRRENRLHHLGAGQVIV